jgi:Fe-S-cluster containining protein
LSRRAGTIELPFRLGRDFEVPGIEPGGTEALLVETQVAATVQILGEDDSLARTVEVADHAHSLHGALVDAWRDAESATLACREGCAFCCSLNVTLTIPEVFRILDALRRDHPRQALVGIFGDAREYAARMRNLSGEERDRVRRPCPLLAGDRCSVHPIRPLACRGWNSFEVAACERDSLHPEEDASVEIPAPPYSLARALAFGIAAGLRLCGIQHDFVHLPSALALGLGEPLAELHARWRCGESVFQAAIEHG